MMKRTAAVGLTCAAIGFGIAMPASAAEPVPPTTTTTDFAVLCRAVPSAYADPAVAGKDVSVKVIAPSEVAPGQAFDAVIDAGSIAMPNSVSIASVQQISRAKLDLLVPDNAELLSAEVADPGNVTAGTTASVTRVDASGNPSASGSILRLSGGNATIGNGPSSSTTSAGGLAIKAQSGAETLVTFPKIKLRLKALDEGSVDIRLRTGGAADIFGSPESFLTFLPQLSAFLIGTIWAPTSCSPRDTEGGSLNAGAGALATVSVRGEEVTTVDPTVRLVVPEEIVADEPASFHVEVTPETATGKVRYLVDGAVVAEVPVTRGLAYVDLTFSRPGSKNITAVFVGDDGSELRSMTMPVLVPGEVATPPVVTAPNTATGSIDFGS